MSGTPFQGGTFGEHVFGEVLVNKRVIDDGTSGSYAITGSDATLRYGYKVAADLGSFAVTGADAATLQKWKIVGGADSYAVTGSDAATLQKWKVAADAGAHSVTGADADLVASGPAGNKTIAADGGSHEVTGSDASPEHGWEVVADPDAYSVVGDDVTFINTTPPEQELRRGGGAPTAAEVRDYLEYMRRLDRQEEERRARHKAKARELEETIAEAYAKAVGKPRLKQALKAIEAPPAFTPESLGVIGHQVAEALSEALEGTGRRFAADRMRLEQLQRSLIEFDGVMRERESRERDDEDFLLLAAM